MEVGVKGVNVVKCKNVCQENACVGGNECVAYTSKSGGGEGGWGGGGDGGGDGGSKDGNEGNGEDWSRHKGGNKGKGYEGVIGEDGSKNYDEKNLWSFNGIAGAKISGTSNVSNRGITDGNNYETAENVLDFGGNKYGEKGSYYMSWVESIRDGDKNNNQKNNNNYIKINNNNNNNNFNNNNNNQMIIRQNSDGDRFFCKCKQTRKDDVIAYERNDEFNSRCFEGA